MTDATISPIKVRDLPRFIKLASPMAAALAQGNWQQALAEHGEDFVNLVALGAGVERAWLDEQTPDVLFELAARVLEVNAPFLTGPGLNQLIEAVARLLNPTVSGGSGSSLPSPEPVSTMNTCSP